jgi:ribosomal protein S18 acetylase RimI-like enzyme
MYTDEVRIVIAQPQHRNGILKLAETALIPYEPVEAALEVTWEEARDSWEKLADACVQHPHSHVAVNVKGEVVGFRLSRILEMEKVSPKDSMYEWLMAGHMKTIADQVTRNWPSVVPRKGKVLQFLALCVDPAYGGRGIAMELVKENLALGKKLGCHTAVVVASNWKSQRVFEKAGFTTIEKLLFTDFKDERGEQIIEMKDPKTTSVPFYIMSLA